MRVDFLKQMYQSSIKRAEQLPFPEDPPLSGVSFIDALNGMAIIAEVKYATPREGLLGITRDPVSLAREYEDRGARAISCLTEPDYFAGSLDYLRIIRAGCRLPLLMKDFIVDERQIAAGRVRGADAVLLITEMLSFQELAELYVYASDLGMDCLVEIHSEEGLEKALAVGASIVGVNSRDLVTLEVDGNRHEELIRLIPDHVVKVAESGISSAQRLAELKEMGYDAALVGRVLAREDGKQEIFHVG